MESRLQPAEAGTPTESERQNDAEDIVVTRRSVVGKDGGGGGMANGSHYAKLIIELSLGVGELESLGVQLKDYSRGLIDFPSMREGRVVLLCWKADEGNQLEWWHDVEAGFAGRQPL